MERVTYECGCKAAGDNISPFCVICGEPIIAETEWYPICQCPSGSLCEFFDKENEICLYGKEK